MPGFVSSSDYVHPPSPGYDDKNGSCTHTRFPHPIEISLILLLLHSGHVLLLLLGRQGGALPRPPHFPPNFKGEFLWERERRGSEKVGPPPPPPSRALRKHDEGEERRQEEEEQSFAA